MKKLLFVFVFLFALSAQAQIQKMYWFEQDITTSWTTVSKASYAKIVQFWVSNDAGTASTDTLWVAFGTDTTRANRAAYLHGESDFYENVYLDAVRLRTSAGTIRARMRYH